MFQSTRPVRGATDRSPIPHAARRVSIHAPRAGRDVKAARRLSDGQVSIHAPRAGRDSRTTSVTTVIMRFNPRAPCGARPDAVLQT